ncbi:MAG TPA: hypothetical protein VFV68_16265 [Agriterribacter sp.]|nr:hypothetical protein [Agriterribacter sp.]
MKHLPLPERDASWQQMKNKLDLEIPLAEGGGKGGSDKWWFTGTLFVTLLAGIWGLKSTTDSNSTTAQANDKDEIALVTATDAGDKITYPMVRNGLNATDQNVTGRIELANNSKQNIIRPSISTEKEYSKSWTEQPNNLNAGNNRYPSVKSKRKKNIEEKVNQSFIEQNNEPQFAAEPDIKKPEGKKASNLLLSEHTTSSALASNDLYHAEENISGANKAVFQSPTLNTVQVEIFNYSTEKNILSPAHSKHLTVPVYVSTLPDVRAQRKSILREIKRKERKEERELSKSYKNYPSFWGESTDRWFAAGIAPYQNFGVASQESYHYNSAAGESIISDYIPAPYLQFHFTNRVYLLGEFQFNSPQATPSLLLAQKTMTFPMSGTGFTENTYLRKLYYFNMPVSFYYSPLKNFYVGSGLQFSSFNSGLANIELTTSNSNIVLDSKTVKIKDDSLSANIKSAEWRYLFDANYYYDRFMFGFRYNQALNNFIDLNVNNSLPPTQARNQAFQFYIRYNLVVGSRKN